MNARVSRRRPPDSSLTLGMTACTVFQCLYRTQWGGGALAAAVLVQWERGRRAINPTMHKNSDATETLALRSNSSGIYRNRSRPCPGGTKEPSNVPLTVTTGMPRLFH